jgi:hypothetical protein
VGSQVYAASSKSVAERASTKARLNPLVDQPKPKEMPAALSRQLEFFSYV